MLPKRAVEKSGFRPLSQHELNAVSGGGVVLYPGGMILTGSRPSSGNLWSGSGDGAGGLSSGLSSFQVMDLGILGSLDLDAIMDFFASPEPDPDTGMTERQEDATKEVAKAFIDEFEQILKNDPKATVELWDGRIVKLADIVTGLKSVIKGLEAGTFLIDLAKGDANLKDAIYIAFGVAVTGAAAAAGTPAGVAAMIGFAAQSIAQNALTIFEWVDAQILMPAEQEFIAQTQSMANQMPNNGASNNVEFMQGIFGTNNPYSGSEEP